MPDLEFTIRFNSPAFLGSVPRDTRRVTHFAQGRTTTDSPHFYPVDPGVVRAPVLRGLLAFWLRSLLGHLEPQEVFRIQGEIFGSTATGQGLSLRPTVLAGPVPSLGELSFQRDIYRFLYLGYGPLQYLKPTEHERVVTSYHHHGCHETLLVGERYPRTGYRFVATGTERQLRALRAALWLLHLFGGLGARSRRGWGSVAVEADGIEGPDGEQRPLDWLLAGLATARRLLPEAAAELPREPAFSAFSASSRIATTEVADASYETVLLDFARSFKRTRAYQKGQGGSSRGNADHALEVADAAAARISRAPARIAFGMPYFPKSSQRVRDPGSGKYVPAWQIEYVARFRGENDGAAASRRASPLLLKVHRLPGGRHVGVALFLAARFFRDRSWEIAAKGKAGTAPFPGYAPICDFLKHPGWRQAAVPTSVERP